jgi:hypothetical protein
MNLEGAFSSLVEADGIESELASFRGLPITLIRLERSSESGVSGGNRANPLVLLWSTL